MIKIYLSRKLGELRLTQADLARLTGIRPTTINEIYHEIAERINIEHLDLICEALGCDLSEIVVYIPNDPPKINHYRAGAQARAWPGVPEIIGTYQRFGTETQYAEY